MDIITKRKNMFVDFRKYCNVIGNEKATNRIEFIIPLQNIPPHLLQKFVQIE